jgi:hypothetical protein
MREAFGVNESKRMVFGHWWRLLPCATALLFGALAAGAAALALLALLDNPLAAIIATAVCATASGVIASLAVALRRARTSLRDLHCRAEDLADRNWELKEAEERGRSLLEAQGDVIVRRDASRLVTYANDSSAGATVTPSRGAAFIRPSSSKAKRFCLPMVRAAMTRRSRAPRAFAGSPGGKSWFAPASRRRCKA